MLFLSYISLASAALQLNFTLQNQPSNLYLDKNALFSRDVNVVDADVNLTSTYNFYYTKLLLGSPAQELEVIIDTGSPISWVFGPNITAGNATQFYPGNSSTWQDMPDTQFSAAYGSGSYRGIWGNDTAAIPEYDNKSVANFPIGVVDSFQAGASAPGLLALGPHIGYAGPSTYKNLPEALYDDGLIDSAGFSISLVNDTGNILFGGVDLGQIEQPIFWYNYTDTSRTYAGFYSVPLTSLTINDNEPHDVRYPAMIDTGSPMSLVPTSFVEQIAEQWNLGNVSAYRAWYLNDTRAPEDLEGWISFRIGYFTIDIPISDMFIPGEYIWGENGPQNVQALSLIGSQNNLLGDVFCRHAYMTFDSSAERVYLSRRKTDNTTLPYIISPQNLTNLAIPGKLQVTESAASFVTSATESGVLYGPAQYLGLDASATLSTADGSSSAEATSTGESSGSAGAASASSSKSGAASSGSSSGSSSGAASSANSAAGFVALPGVAAFALALML